MKQSKNLNGTKHSRSRCIISGCHVETSHLKKHVIGRHLPKFVSSKSSLSLEEQMKKYENLLMSIARDVGCLSLHGLFNFVLRRKWFQRTKCTISGVDLAVMQNFQFWISGKECPLLTINPSNCIVALTHWRVLSYLLDRVAAMKQSTKDSTKSQERYNASIWKK